MLEMSTVDQTQEWEESLKNDDGDLKFPVAFLDRLETESLEIKEVNIDIGKPRLVELSVKEIKLGKKPNKKGNELF
jgi:hypothetical protein